MEAVSILPSSERSLTSKFSKILKHNPRHVKETASVESTYNQPNAETKEAINEARSGKTAGKVDMSSFDGFLESINKS